MFVQGEFLACSFRYGVDLFNALVDPSGQVMTEGEVRGLERKSITNINVTTSSGQAISNTEIRLEQIDHMLNVLLPCTLILFLDD